MLDPGLTETVAPIPDGPIPRHLYKYRSLEGRGRDFARDLVVKQELYFAGPRELNDPFECRPYLAELATATQRREYARKAVHRNGAGLSRQSRRVQEKRILSDPAFRAKLRQSYEITMGKLGIYSLSAEPLDLLMWPHYADNHRGICVRFDVSVLLNAGRVPMPVTYSSERPASDPMVEEPKTMFEKAALTKGLPWSYEKEWRLIENRIAGQIVKAEAPLITGVILGANISRDDREVVRRWVGSCGREVQVFEARFHERSYALELDELTVG